MNLTLSIGSRVPPAVTSTFNPRQISAADPPIGDRLAGSPMSPAGARPASTLSHTSSSRVRSAKRPTPSSPFEASRPTPGSTISSPRSRSTWRLAWVASFSYMWLFIAGATTTGQVAASAQLLNRLSASPWASFASVFAEAGAIR